MVTSCESVSPALDAEIKTEVQNEDVKTKTEVKKEDGGILLKSKQIPVAKSAAQIMHEQSQKYVHFFSSDLSILHIYMKL